MGMGTRATWACLAMLGGLGLLSCERGELSGIEAAFQVGPEAVDFGAVPLGDGLVREVKFLNQGRVPVDVGGITSGVASVEVMGPVRFRLAPGEERAVQLRFQPAVEGLVKGALQVQSDLADDAGGLRSVALSGTGVRSFVDAQVDVLDFGSVEVDTVEVLELPLINPSRAEATARVTLEGPDVDQFGSSEQGREIRVRPGELVRLPISFRPLRLGAAQAVARVVRCPVCEPTLVQLIGNGVASMLEIAPSRVDFGRVSLGTRAEQRVTVRNNGNVPLTYRGSQVLKDPEARFRLEAQPPIDSVLAPGAGFELLVSFTPQVTGMVNGPLLEVGLRADNTVGPGPKLPLLGEGGMACILFQPAALDFGPVPEGMSTTRTAFAFNRCQEPVTLLDAAITAGQGGFFSLPKPQSGLVIAPGARVPISVAFMPKPGSSGSTAELRARSQQGTSTSTAGLPLTGSLGTFEPCQYRLDPVPLDFGRVQVGSVVTMGWILTNAGKTDCYLAGMNLAAGSDQAFSAPPVEGRVLKPGERALLPVSFQPSAPGPFVALAEAWVNHPTLGHPTATLTGEGVQACVAVEPASIDFGLVKRGCGVRERGVVVHNRCTVPVSLTGFELASQATIEDELSMSLVPALPAALAPGARANLSLAYEPADDGQDSAALRLTTDAAGELTVGVLAAGLARPIQSDRFVQEAEDKVDVLFVVDNSGSMMEEQQSLGQNFASFLSAAQGQGVDYHIAVTTTGIESSPGGWSVCPGGAEGGEGGRLFPPDNSSPRIITPQTPNAASVFANNVRVGWCHWNEQGLEAAYRALSAPLVNSVDDARTALPQDGNAGFLREEARLVVVFLSDEEDFSPQSTAFYETFFRGLKGNDETMLSISAIAGPENLSTCPTASSSGTRYLALARATGGATESICTPNWAASLEKLSTSVFGPKRRFPLSAEPEDPAAVTVTVNGIPVSTGWTYDAEENAVVFDAASVPPPGAIVEITYPLGC